MKLYLVTCNGGWNHEKTFEVYVLALHPNQASDMALAKMRELNYLYTDFVSKVEFIASTDHYRANGLIIIEEA